MNIKRNIPNILSTIRLAMALALPYVFLNTSLLNTLIFYLVGDATDAIDGHLARKWKVQSKYGKIVDPIADKLLNGLTLLLTSIFINPVMFVLTGFEALIAATNILRVKRKSDINVAQIGRIKTVCLFFATISALAVPMVPSLTIASNVLIGATATLQAFTAGKYLKEFRSEKKAAKEESCKPFQIQKVNNNEDEIRKLKYAKEKLKKFEAAKETSSKKIEGFNIKQVSLYEENINEQEEKGISRTLKK
jgi:phosphatidylglycerophosphate synthase